MKKVTNLTVSKELYIRIADEASRCTSCKKCMDHCPMLSSVCTSPKALLNESVEAKSVKVSIPYSCTQCGYCTKGCPNGVDLQGTFKFMREDAVKNTGRVPKSIKYRVVKFHQKNSFSKYFSAASQGTGGGNVVFFPGCSLMAYSPDMVMKTYDYLKQKNSRMAILMKCCGNPTASMGDMEGFHDYYNSLEEDLKRLNAKKIITSCLNCYKTIKKHSPWIEVTSLWEEIAVGGIPPNVKGIMAESVESFALHDPCPIREEVNIHESVRKITRELGLQVEEFPLNREKTLCCGSGGMVGVTNPTLALKQMRKRAQQTKSEIIISYCQECVESMKRGGKRSVHLLDLLFNPEIFKSYNQTNKNIIEKWTNRYRGKLMVENIDKRD